MIEKLLDNSEHLVSVFKMGSKQVDVDDYVNKWHTWCQINYIVRIWIGISGFEAELTVDNFVKFFENTIFGHCLIFWKFALNSFVHSIQIFVKTDFILDQFWIAILVELFVFPGHMHIVGFIIF